MTTLEQMQQQLQQLAGQIAQLHDDNQQLQQRGGQEGEQQWRKWSTILKGFIIGAYNKDFRRVMTWVAENPHGISQADWQANFGFGADQQDIVDSSDDKVGQMYLVLQQLTTKETFGVVHN
eukprot:5068378-Amphidinium_carterae.1